MSATDGASFPDLRGWRFVRTEDPDFDRGLRTYARSTQAQRQALYQAEFLDSCEFYADVDEDGDGAAPCDPSLADSYDSLFREAIAELNGWLAGWCLALERRFAVGGPHEL